MLPTEVICTRPRPYARPPLLLALALAVVAALSPMPVTAQQSVGGETELSAGKAVEVGIARGESDTSPDGAFTYQIPIELPAGRADHHPGISLRYSSNGANGVLGVGWTLSGFPAISRVNLGEGIEYDGSDTYVFLADGWGSSPGLDAALVKTGPDRFRTARDINADFEAVGTCGDGPCHWVMTDQEGNRWYFGGDYGVNAGTDPHTQYAIWERFNGVHERRGIAVWGLRKVEDRHGNYYYVDYRDGPGTLYPERVFYTLHPAAQNQAFNLREIRFSYDTRHDATEARRSDRRASSTPTVVSPTILRTASRSPGGASPTSTATVAETSWRCGIQRRTIRSSGRPDGSSSSPPAAPTPGSDRSRSSTTPPALASLTTCSRAT